MRITFVDRLARHLSHLRPAEYDAACVAGKLGVVAFHEDLNVSREDVDYKLPRPFDLGDVEIILARDSPELNEILQRLAMNAGLIFRFTPLEVQMQGDGGSAKVVCRFVGTELPADGR